MDSKPYERLKFYQDICEIRRFVYKLTEKFGSSHYRLISQMRDCARSAKQNIREGYKKGSIGEYIHSIKISQGSLEELSGDMEDCLEDGLITQDEFEKFITLYRSAEYMSSRYLMSMYKIKKKGTWKIPGKQG
jgi:four helix bundle protein